jgi:type I restriction enzyme S subunit
MTASRPSDWSFVTVPAALDEQQPIIRPSGKIAARDYRPNGRFAIIDQSQNPVAGWTDSEEAVLHTTRPVIVFGDHTRSFKYVDYPFAAGADGTLILNPSKEFDPRFLYFACLDLDLPSRGYNRHFSLLKDMSVPKPPRPEQQKIAAVLEKVQAAVDAEGKLIRLTRELKQAAMRQLLTRGLRAEPQKETDIGPIPESWEIKGVGELCTLSSGGTPDRSNVAFWKDGTIPWVKTGEVDYRVVERTEEHITERGLKNSAAKLLPPGTIIMAMYGQGITRGRVARLGIAATTNQACAAILPKEESGVSSDYLYYFFTYAYERLRALGHGANQRNLNLEIIRQVTLPLPKDEGEQREIAAHLAAIDAKLAHHEKRQNLLRELFRTVLRDLMARRRRLTGPDLGKIFEAPNGVIGARRE